MSKSGNPSFRNSFGQRMKALVASAERERVWMAWTAALFVACSIYRADLAMNIYAGKAQPASLQPANVPFVSFMKTLADDEWFVAGLALTYLALKLWGRWRMPRFVASRRFVVTESLFAGTLLLLLALILKAHEQLLFELETGLTMTLVTLSPTLFGVKDFLHLFTLGDVVFLLTPLAGFFLFIIFAGLLRSIYRPLLLVSTGVVLAFQAWPASRRLTPELAENPVRYFAGDVLKAPWHAYFGKRNAYANNRDLPGPAQMNSIPLVDAAFVNPPGTAPTSAMPGSKSNTDAENWNVLIFVLESTGADYVFDNSGGLPMPMPFLHRMAEEGLVLANHHTTCNSSPSAAFSIFTGLYPRPTHEIFSLTDTASIPTLNTFLPGDRDCFLVYPSSLTYCFPTSLLIKSHFTEMHSQQNLPPGEHPDVTGLARNEIDAITFLMQRLDQARTPFLGVYWSFIPHHPYSDYGPEYRIRPDLTIKRDLYYNNLRALDTQLHRVYEHLANSGQLDHTLLVFVGDHGEAFGQHPGVWAHSFGSYEEMYRTPMIFWQPRLIQPRVTTFPTSHVDILPTLLDLLHQPFHRSRFQGESVLQNSRRKCIFTMDAQADYLSAIDPKMNKVTVDFANGRALAYNLAKDPGEKLPLNEDSFSAQIEAILKFRNYQTRLIDDYNHARIAREVFPANSGITNEPVPDH